MMPKKIVELNSAESELRACAGIDAQTAAAPGGDGADSAKWKKWAIAGCAAGALVIAGAVFFPSIPASKQAPAFVLSEPKAMQSPDSSGYEIAPAQKTAGIENRVNGIGLMAPAPPATAGQALAGNGQTAQLKGQSIAGDGQAPMIARTVSLTILAKDFAAARAAIDSILARHHGYSASLTMDTPANGQGSLRASLRIPAAEISPALGDLKALGRVLSESQSGEEVTEQHADLAARLENSHEEELRLRDILERRTGKIEDVLQVEEQIARVRGEIEQMEAAQKALEHRVDFVTADLRVVQEYREQLAPSGASASATTQLRNALVAGLRHAGGTVLGILLVLEEFGPATLIWLAILGTPAFFAMRLYRGTRKQA